MASHRSQSTRVSWPKIRSRHYNCHFTFLSSSASVAGSSPGREESVYCSHTHEKKQHHNPASAAIKAINQPWLGAKIESCSDGYICYIPSSICLAASDNAASSVCKHVVPITPTQLAKHEMTVEAVRGAFCLQTRRGGGRLRFQQR